MEEQEYLKLIDDWKVEHKEEIENGKVRKVFLENLPRAKSININWQNSINYKVYFIYEDVKGYILITDYIRIKNKHSRIKIKYKNKEIDISTGHFYNCKIGSVLDIKTSDFKIEIGTVFKDNKRDIIITDRKKLQDEKTGQWCKYYKYKCNKCGFDCGKHYSVTDKKYKNEHWILESSLITQKQGCSCCSASLKTIVENINSIYHTDKWMISYIGEECAKTHTHSSYDECYPICPDCGRVKQTKMKIATIYQTHSIGCSCSDKISFNEKAMFNILEQLKINFITQLTKNTLKWCGKYKYDFYFEFHNEGYVIETHGLQHYEENGNWKMSLKEVQENDKLKKELALKNGIKEENYIIINCQKSEIEWIKNNDNGILHSRLNELFDLSNIDWIKAEIFACCNLVKIVCEHKKNNPKLTTTEIGELTHISIGTVINYLKKGTKFGWCNYNPDEEKIKSSTRIGKQNGIKVEIFKNGLSLGIFESGTEIQRISNSLFGVKLLQSAISMVCLGKIKQHKGYTFKYVK